MNSVFYVKKYIEPAYCFKWFAAFLVCAIIRLPPEGFLSEKPYKVFREMRTQKHTCIY